MENDRNKAAGRFERLQRDVDEILRDVGHLFDHMAEYHYDVDPLHAIDIDEVLTENREARIERPAPRRKVRLYSSYRMPESRHVRRRAEPVVRAMPKELQEQAKIYETILKRRSEGILPRVLRSLLMRLSF